MSVAHIIIVVSLLTIAIFAAVWGWCDRNLFRRNLDVVMAENSRLKQVEERARILLAEREREAKGVESLRAVQNVAIRFFDTNAQDRCEVVLRKIGDGVVLARDFVDANDTIRSKVAVSVGVFDACARLVGKLRVDLFDGSFRVETSVDDSVTVSADGRITEQTS